MIPTALQNIAHSALRRALSIHKPLVRVARRRARAREHAMLLERVQMVEAELARVAAGRGPIIAGPWLAEVGYEVLYWVPFLRWVQDRFRIAPERLIVVSRGGVAHWYEGLAARYVEIFDLLPPQVLAEENSRRQTTDEGGGRKQSRSGDLDERLIALVESRAQLRRASVLHPSLMFRMFRDVWQGNLALDVLWSRTRYVRIAPPPRPVLAELPSEYIAVRLYSGTALPDRPEIRALLRRLVEVASSRLPVVLLDTGLAVDDHGEYRLDEVPNVVSARRWMTAQTNLAVQTAVIAHARSFLGTCGGLAWLAPFLGVPTAAVFADDALLGPHLAVARRAARRVGAADFAAVDLRAFDLIGAQLEAGSAAPRGS